MNNTSLNTAKSPELNNNSTATTTRRTESLLDLQTMSGSSVDSTESDSSILNQSYNPSPKINRYYVTLLVFVSASVLFILSERLALWNSTWSRMLASFIAPITAFFLYEWSFIHSSGLTRKNRAFWDEKNILLTYQPRARFEGHKFKPDPPTPGPGLPPLLEGGCIGSAPHESLSEEQLAEKKRETFEANRNAHYANEFALAINNQEKLPPESSRIDVPIIPDSLASSPINGPDRAEPTMRPVLSHELFKDSKPLGSPLMSSSKSPKSLKSDKESLAQNDLKSVNQQQHANSSAKSSVKSPAKSPRGEGNAMSLRSPRSLYAEEPDVPLSDSERKPPKKP